MRRLAASLVLALALLTSTGGRANAGGGGADWYMSAALPAFDAVAITVRSDATTSPPAAEMALEDKAGNPVYRFPPLPGTGSYAYFQTRDMALVDLNEDGRDDVVVIVEVMTGIGPSGAEPFPLAGVYLRRADAFERSTELEERLNSVTADESWSDLQSTLGNLATVPGLPD